jgi:hypothetical protein
MSKRRQFTVHFKAEVVLSVLSGVKSQAEVCRDYQLTPQMFIFPRPYPDENGAGAGFDPRSSTHSSL